jgi:lysophospholipase L1-like esterase
MQGVRRQLSEHPVVFAGETPQLGEPVLHCQLRHRRLGRPPRDQVSPNAVEAHVPKWIFCVGVFPCAEDVRTQYNGRARAMHEVARRTVADLALPKLRFLDGLQAMTLSRDVTSDLTHPSPAGMISIGTWAARAIAESIEGNPAAERDAP